jgi:hypothetical protein
VVYVFAVFAAIVERDENADPLDFRAYKVYQKHKMGQSCGGVDRRSLDAVS